MIAGGDDFTKHRLAWLEAISEDALLTGAVFRVAIKIATKYLNRKTGDAWPGILTLAADVGLSERGARLAIRLLEARGWMYVKTGGGGHNSTNRYKIVFAKPCLEGHASSPRGAQTGIPEGHKRVFQRGTNGYSRGARQFPQTL
jgi:hypothetical protein